MDATTLFGFGNSYVLLGWILLIFLPDWKHTQTIVQRGVILLLSIIYSYLILKGIGYFSLDSFSTLANVKALFQADDAVAAGWMHYLTFDLFVGSYIVAKSRSLNISRWVYTLILPFTFMFGPIGYVLFTLAKIIKTKSIHETN